MAAAPQQRPTRVGSPHPHLVVVGEGAEAVAWAVQEQLGRRVDCRRANGCRQTYAESSCCRPVVDMFLAAPRVTVARGPERMRQVLQSVAEDVHWWRPAVALLSGVASRIAEACLPALRLPAPVRDIDE